MNIEEISKLFECSREATLSKVEFFVGLTLMNILILGEDKVEGLGTFKLNKENKKISLSLELEEKWISLLNNTKVEEVLFNELKNKLGM